MAVAIIDDGTSGADEIFGRRGADILSGAGDNDIIKGRGGKDTLDGGEGDDVLNGGGGRDTLFGGIGNDTLIGGRGNDTFIIDADIAGRSVDTITDFDFGRSLRNMVWEDKLEIRNADGVDILFEQDGDDVNLYVGGELMAIFQGSEGAITAQDLLDVTTTIGTPSSIGVGEDMDDPEEPEEPKDEPSFDGIVFRGISEFDYSGYSVSAAGDVDGDGLDDFLIGAPDANQGENDDVGEVYLIFGTDYNDDEVDEEDLGELGSNYGIIINGISAEDFAGYSVSSAGDVDGDGLADILIGAPDVHQGEKDDAGEIYLIFGSALDDGQAEFNLADLTAEQGVIFKGVDEDDYSGFAVSSAGDVDGDGKDDILISTPYATQGGLGNYGETYLVFASAINAAEGEIDLATLTPSQGVTFIGANEGDYSGWSISEAGDIDDDGFDDILISATDANQGENIDVGETYFIFGSAINDAEGQIELGNLTADQGIVIRGIDAGDYSGFSVSSAGDVDGDGINDILIGATDADQGENGDAGETYLIFGAALNAAEGEIDLATLTADQGVLIKGVGAGDYSGFSVSSAGDVDGDGFDDILIGAYDAAHNDKDEAGETYLIFGSALKDAEGEIDLATLTSDQGIVIRGIDAFDNSGYSVSSAGDFDGDGLDDIIIGASGANRGFDNNTGETYLISGALLTAEMETGDGVIELAELFPQVVDEPPVFEFEF